MDTPVAVQRTSVCKTITTITALKRLLTRVAALVYFEMATLVKAFIAVLAFIGSLPSVETQVYVQSTFVYKMFMT